MNHPSPMEKDFFVLKIDEKNYHHRIYSEHLINEWIDNLSNVRPGYKIEFAVDLNEQNLKTEYVKDSLYCGVVTKLYILQSETGEKILRAKAKFKINGPYSEKFSEPNFFDNLTLVPKGSGKVWDNKIYDYELIGFNLIPQELSPFIDEEPEED